ncbi:syntaxin-18 [Sabethes cyaneus]|uniref:syntaxin-18 n=1 Tax=Sabethes cyaneus TaxID=53552 RepID=UPI00221E3015|nr:syntaxin-18 [Sabethes cyaneus]
MDITLLFRASVKTVRLKSDTFPLWDKSRILKRRPNMDFIQQAKQIRFQITQLKNLLLENRAAYMQFAHHLKNSTHMTDDERDIIDRESENIIQMCMARLIDFRANCCNARCSKQTAELMDLIIETLTRYMNAVHQIANEQRRFRIQRELEMYNLLKLNSGHKFTVLPNPTSGREEALSVPKNSLYETVQDVNRQENKLQLNVHNTELFNSVVFDEDEELSPEDIQLFESENVQLYSELKGLSEEVEQIERNVSDITHLQQVFTEKVSLQKTDIERIANTVVGATENVKDANDQIKQAIQRNAGLRVWVLFFLIVMSLTLLFLDWYND